MQHEHPKAGPKPARCETDVGMFSSRIRCASAQMKIIRASRKHSGCVEPKRRLRVSRSSSDDVATIILVFGGSVLGSQANSPPSLSSAGMYRLRDYPLSSLSFATTNADTRFGIGFSPDKLLMESTNMSTGLVPLTCFILVWNSSIRLVVS